MLLTGREVAALCDTSESTVARWTRAGGLPASNVSGENRFNPAQVLAWAIGRRAYVSADLLQEWIAPGRPAPSLGDALQSGGVLQRVNGDSLPMLAEQIVKALLLPEGYSERMLVDVLMSRAGFGLRSVGDEIAVPDPLAPLILPVDAAAMTLCHLTTPLPLHDAQGNFATAVFVLVSPTTHVHLSLVAQLSTALADLEFRDLVKRRGSHDHLIRAAHRLRHEPGAPSANGSRWQSLNGGAR